MDQDHSRDSMGRREALSSIGLGAAAGVAAMGLAGRTSGQPGARQPFGWGVLTAEELGWSEAGSEFVLPDLPYEPDALEPAIDAETMRIHHGKHHAGYVRGFNAALRMLGEAPDGAGAMRALGDDLAFNGSGAFNHALFWQVMAPTGRGGGGEPSGGPLAEAINRNFGTFARFKASFSAAAGSVRGSGWAWLVVEPISRRLVILAGHNQQDSFIHGAHPILGIDVWEHAYYLKYQNERGRYIANWWSVVNWSKVAELHARVMD